MSGAGSASTTAATTTSRDRLGDGTIAAVIVAHGQPGDPAPQEAAMRALAAEVASLLPGAAIRGATLAMDGSLPAAIEALGAPMIYPFFLAEGYFTGRLLPARLARSGDALRQLAPFGLEPDLPALIARVTLEGAAGAGLDPARSTLLLAAHGSAVSKTSKDSAHAMAARIDVLTPFARVRVGLIEEPPFLVDAARDLGPGLCLPFFALHAGHVRSDIPQALAQAGFSGPCLPAIGQRPEVPGLIAASLRRAAAEGTA